MTGKGSDADPLDAIIDDIDRHIPKSVRLEMLDLVLAWARVDAAIAQLASTLFGMRPTMGAVIFNRMRVPDRLQRLKELCEQLDNADGVKHFKKIKKQYEVHAKPRNLIAHAVCIGITKSEPQCLVFLPYEPEGFGNLAIEKVGLDLLRRSIQWGSQIETEVNEYLNSTDFWEMRN